METADIIKTLRERNGWTQEELGEKVGVKKSAVAKWENGRVENLKRNMIESLSSIFGVTPSYLMGWDNGERNFHPAIFGLHRLLLRLRISSIIPPSIS